MKKSYPARAAFDDPQQAVDSWRTARQRFMFSGIDLPHAALLCWGGQPGIAGLEGFDLYRRDDSVEGAKMRRVNRDLLPLEGVFYDAHGRSIAQVNHELVNGMFGAPIDAPSHPLYLRIWKDFMCAAGASPLHDIPDPGQGRTKMVPAGKYLLVGKFIGGNRDGTFTTEEKQARAWTAEDRRAIRESIDDALESIKTKGAVAQLSNNSEGVDYDTLMAHVVIEADCGEIGEQNKLGHTWPNGQIAPGSNRAKSAVTLNGHAVLDMGPAFLELLILHELAHAVQFYHGVPEAFRNGDLNAAATESVEQERQAYEAIWDAMASGLYNAPNNFRCNEIAAAIAAITNEFEQLAEIIVAAGDSVTEEVREQIQNLRGSVRGLLLKYKQFLDALPADTESCLFHHRTGDQESLKDVVDRLLSEVFPG